MPCTKQTCKKSTGGMAPCVTLNLPGATSRLAVGTRETYEEERLVHNNFCLVCHDRSVNNECLFISRQVTKMLSLETASNLFAYPAILELKTMAAAPKSLTLDFTVTGSPFSTLSSRSVGRSNFLTKHSDPFVGYKGTKKIYVATPINASETKFLDIVLGPFKDLIERATKSYLWLFCCSAIVNNSESFANLKTSVLNHTFPRMLGHSYNLGWHSNIFLFTKNSDSLDVLPSCSMPKMWVDSWTSVNQNKVYYFECKNRMCKQSFKFCQPENFTRVITYAMSSDWTCSFRTILVSYKSDFLAVKDSKSGQSRVIKKVHKAIVAAHKEQGEKVPLPSSFKKALKKYYADQIDDGESDGEGAAKEREISACPKEASFYKKKLTDWDMTQKLFKHEINEFDKAEQARKGVNDPIKFRTGHAREWFNKMSPTQKKEVEYAREKWNKEGAPEESQAIYCKNNLKKVLEEFSEQLHYQTLSVALHEFLPQNAKKSFLVSSDSIKEWASTGFEFFAEWAKTKYYPTANLDYKEEDEHELPKVVLDNEGYALLPSRQEVTLKNQQELIRMIFHTAYTICTVNQCIFIEVFTGSTNLVFCDPSHMRAKDIDILWSYWERRSTTQKRLVTFIKARSCDMRIDLPHSPRDGASTKKDKAYAEVTSEDDEQHSSANLDTTLAAASPVEVLCSDCFAFLDALSTDRSYLELVDAVKDLAIMMENLQLLQEELELPNWVNWSWKDSYLLESVHESQDMVMASLELMRKAPIQSVYSAALVVLGLGMILRDCKRVIEYEEDEAPPGTPSYLASSNLDLQCIIKVDDAISHMVCKVVGLIEVAMKAASGHSDNGDQEEEMEGADGEEDKTNEREKSIEQDQEGEQELVRGDMDVQMEEVGNAYDEEQEEGMEKGKKRMKSQTSARKSKKARSEDEPIQ
ncbi:uncharacterized protein BJ212DRAFT_1304913 [Suillus subaureus]|uniref:Uncharacterized protein n=1 Tax=Suillus subaureus TaxID=48587 RepID=A0A9P7J4A1_9AGAM|nr:uncharacterized protein BJ212DRAFT_1304913 [Suillus subaureus]KAG1801990.1 hypothetical protein BJ212DRAFT_1304913 [Suillus subaureus]